MTFTVAHITPLVALIAGILILIMPRLLNYHRGDLSDPGRPGRPQRHSPFHPLTWNLRPLANHPGLRRGPQP